MIDGALGGVAPGYPHVISPVVVTAGRVWCIRPDPVRAPEVDDDEPRGHAQTVERPRRQRPAPLVRVSSCRVNIYGSEVSRA